MQGPAREVWLPASAAAKGLGSFLNMLAPPTNNDMVDAAPVSPPAPVTTLMQSAGAIDRPDLQPQNERERAESAAFQGLGGSLPFLPFGGAAAIAPTALSGLGSGLGSYAGSQWQAHPIIGSLLGGVAGGGVGGLLGGGITKTGNAILGNYGDVGQAYQDAGVPLNFTGANGVTAYSSKSLGGSGRTQSLIGQESAAFGKSAEDTAATLGNSTSLQELGDTAQNAGKQWVSDFKNQSAQAHNAVTSAVGAFSPVAPTQAQSVLSDITNAAGGSAAAESFLKSGLTKDVERIVQTAPNGTLPWATVRAIRTRIGEQLENPQLIADGGTAQAKRLYGALTDDLQSAAANSPNPSALPLFNLANQFTANGHNYIENVLAPLMSKDTPSAARWMLNSAKGGDQVLGPLRQNMPNVADDVAAFKLRDMALAPNGSQNAAGTQVSPGSFLTDWNALAPEAKAALYQDPTVATRVNALAQIAGAVKQRQALVNHSNTAHSTAIGAAAFSAAKGAQEGYEAYGLPGGVAGAVAGAALLPSANYAYSFLGANRPLARIMAAQGPGVAPGLLGTASGLSLGTAPQLGLLGRQYPALSP